MFVDSCYIVELELTGSVNRPPGPGPVAHVSVGILYPIKRERIQKVHLAKIRKDFFSFEERMITKIAHTF